MKDISRFRRGGIHPKESKLTADKPIVKAHMPRQVRIPMAMHLGAPAKLLVEAGQEVTEGQLIGEACGFVSANIHASVSGKILSIEKKNTLTAKNVDIVTIETGGSIRNWYDNKRDYKNMLPAEIIEAVKAAGVVGLGGAAFPTHVKLAPPADKPIRTLIVNGAECEPYLTIDHRMMLEKTDAIIDGIRILQVLLKPQKVLIGIEENKQDAIEAFRAKLAGEKDIEVKPLRTRYPQGGEKQLIEALTGMEVPSGGLPMDIGVVVENVSTLDAIYEAVVYGKPLIERGITYTGEGVPNPGNYKVRIGTTFQSIIDEYGQSPDKVRGPYIAGGPMMGIEIPDLNIPVVKGTSGLLSLPKKKNYLVEQKPCIRCTRCLMVCPVGLQPTYLALLCDALKVQDAVDIGLMDCIECGCCSFACPSTIPIVGLIRYGKEFYRRQQAAKKK